MLPFEVLVLFFFLFAFKADEQAVVAWNLGSISIFFCTNVLAEKDSLYNCVFKLVAYPLMIFA